MVKFIPNPYYDDHFDIRSDKFLLGKTLNMIGKTTDDVMGRSCQLIGWGLYEKFDKGLKLLRDFLASDQEYSVTQDAVRMVCHLSYHLILRMLFIFDTEQSPLTHSHL